MFTVLFNLALEKISKDNKLKIEGTLKNKRHQVIAYTNDSSKPDCYNQECRFRNKQEDQIYEIKKR